MSFIFLTLIQDLIAISEVMAPCQEQQDLWAFSQHLKSEVVYCSHGGHQTSCRERGEIRLFSCKNPAISSQRI